MRDSDDQYQSATVQVQDRSVNLRGDPGPWTDPVAITLSPSTAAPPALPRGCWPCSRRAPGDAAAASRSPNTISLISRLASRYGISPPPPGGLCGYSGGDGNRAEADGPTL
ncbi:MAG: hypothetical protein R3F43_17805 [bacterium]